VPITATNRFKWTQMAGRTDSAGSAVVFAISHCIRACRRFTGGASPRSSCAPEL